MTGKTLASFCSSLLLIAMFGLYPNYAALKIGIFILLFALAAVSYVQHYKYFSLSFLLVALLFNPLIPISLSRSMWIFIDCVLIVHLFVYVFWTTDAHQKGSRFEKFVTSLFPEDQYVILDRTRDTGKRLGRYVESDKNPDLLFKKRSTGESFAVECKWRGAWTKAPGYEDSGIAWKTEWTLRYGDFGRKLGVPVMLALGIGGTPEKPQEVYLVPIDKLRWNFIKQSYVIENGEKLF